MVTDPAMLSAIRGKEVVAIVEKRRSSVVPGLNLGVAPDDTSLGPIMRRRKDLVKAARESLRDA